MPEGNSTAGAKIFKTRSAQCRIVKEGGAYKISPNLQGIFGKLGQAHGYQYSAASQEKGVVWGDQTNYHQPSCIRSQQCQSE